MLVLVTGASKGIGFEIVKEMKDRKGLFIIAVSRNIAPLEAYIRKNNTSNILAISADITSAKDRKKIKSTISKLKMPLMVLINNAGLLISKPFEKITEKDLTAVYTTNVFAPFLLIQELLALIPKKNGAHIVNIGSIGGVQGSSKFAGLSAYSSSKAAFAGLSECLAEELKASGIAVNCLALGAVQTEMLAKAFPGYKAPLKAKEMASYVSDFALNAARFYNGKILSVSSTTP